MNRYATQSMSNNVTLYKNKNVTQSMNSSAIQSKNRSVKLST